MVRSLNSHQMATFLPYFNTLNEHRFNLEYLQIPSRHTNDIKHSFIFKKPFFNVFHAYNGITGYISPFHYRLMSLSNSTTFLPSFYPHSDWILSMSFSVKSSVFPLQISTIWGGFIGHITTHVPLSLFNENTCIIIQFIYHFFLSDSHVYFC